MKDVDARDKPGHDGWVGPTWMPAASARSKASPRPGMTTGEAIRHHHGQLDTASCNGSTVPLARPSLRAPAGSLRHGREATKLCFAPMSRPSTFFLGDRVLRQEEAPFP